MSKKSKSPIENATEVIERFGGIRPMSHKTKIPVTTIQGWKKRNSIPANRLDEITQAALSHDVDLSGLIEKGTANQNNKPAANTVVEPAKNTDTNETNIVHVSHAQNHESNNSQSNDDIAHQLAQMEGRAVQKSVLMSVGAFIIILGAIAVLLWPKAQDANNTIENNAEQIASLENKVDETASGINASVSDFIPQGWQDQFDGFMGQAESIKNDAIAAKEQAQVALEKVQEISNDVLGAEAGTLDQRVQKLQGHTSDLMATPQVQSFMAQLNGMGTSVPGQETLSGAQNELSGLLSSFTGAPDQLNAYLDQARLQSSALGQTFDNVPADDMKAAALLFTFNQMRAALNREGQPFNDDLQLLKNFVGQDSTELHAAIDRLAPRAQDGVLTVEGLSKEFRDIAGDAVVASLQGEDVSVQERAQARFNELFSMERDGELITGTDTQAQLAEINNLLEQNKLDEAISKANALEGPEAEVVQPWIEEARNTQAAQTVQDILGYNIDLRTQEGVEGAPAQGEAIGSGNMIYDPKSGLRIYLPGKTMNAP